MSLQIKEYSSKLSSKIIVNEVLNITSATTSSGDQFDTRFQYNMSDRNRDRRTEHTSRERMLVRARAQMLAEVCARTNRYTEVRASILAEERARMLA